MKNFLLCRLSLKKCCIFLDILKYSTCVGTFMLKKPLFQTLCLLLYPNLPIPTFIPDPTFISDPRVACVAKALEMVNHLLVMFT